ncbi:hypothetical protein EI983_17530 [Roseovarius faecimaris]|uniref:Uncharacterized protein n=1 Tax=Roseovarius faecimaris TaxID=2494550 RepID=A0A6I6IWE1_9RHOB|nr:hypothetical protein [Roseovarius faecimaris]QGX99971.1 hypothetical protein EI983_17530 [Roseovarius faecimaris]
MAQALLGAGATVLNASCSGDPALSGTCSGDDTGASGGTPGRRGAVLATGVGAGDTAQLDVDFIPAGDVLTMRLLFTGARLSLSAEGTGPDSFAVWINGRPVPLSPGESASAFGKAQGSHGLSAAMTLIVPVHAGQVNSIRFGLAGDKAGSEGVTLRIVGEPVRISPRREEDGPLVCGTGTGSGDVLANDVESMGGTLIITHVDDLPTGEAA